jgi:hypothetical protein
MRFLETAADYKTSDHIRNKSALRKLNIFDILDEIVEYQTDRYHQLERAYKKLICLNVTDIGAHWTENKSETIQKMDRPVLIWTL